jgi:hypothetical protein
MKRSTRKEKELLPVTLEILAATKEKVNPFRKQLIRRHTLYGC